MIQAISHFEVNMELTPEQLEEQRIKKIVRGKIDDLEQVIIKAFKDDFKGGRRIQLAYVLTLIDNFKNGGKL
jgi:hypothetical protein